MASRTTTLACLAVLCLLSASPLPAPAAKSKNKAAATEPATQPATQPAQTTVGELVPSEDPLIPDLHSLGLINGRFNIFRSASPVRDLVKKATSDDPTPAALAEATTRMKHLYDLGIRTIISFESPTVEAPESDAKPGADAAKPKNNRPAVNLEKAAAAAAGIAYVSHPLVNSGKNSLEDMTAQQALTALAPIDQDIFAASAAGAVLIHCSAGHDRTGVVCAYLRLKYEHWDVQQAIDEMRRYGHNFVKYADQTGLASWHEDLLRQIAPLLSSEKSTPDQAAAK